jgi:hypothetical protein
MTKVTFEEALEDDDWGLIIDKKGRLKGLFIPDGADEDDVPDEIIQLCVQHFGIDPKEFYGDEDEENPTLH